MSGLAVVQKPLAGQVVPPLESIQSAPEPAKDAPISSKRTRKTKTEKPPKVVKEKFKPSKEQHQLASFIVDKYVRPPIKWPLEMTFAYRLVQKFVEPEFWQQMPVKHKVESLILISGPVGLKRLGYHYEDFKRNLQIQQAIILPEKEPEIILGEKVGEDYKPTEKKKPGSVLDFCK